MKRATVVVISIAIVVVAVVAVLAFGAYESQARRQELFRLYLAHGVSQGVTPGEITDTISAMRADDMTVTRLKQMGTESLMWAADGTPWPVCVKGVPWRLVNTICRRNGKGDFVPIPTHPDSIVLQNPPAVASSVR